MVLFLRAVGYDDDQIDKIMFRNAARFLDLSKDEREKFGENSTRGRLERFYAAHDLSTDWMTVFDRCVDRWRVQSQESRLSESSVFVGCCGRPTVIRPPAV